jgi:hypothetical protein
MERNYIFVFQRSQSDLLPPRFRNLAGELDCNGIYNPILSHPKADWNKIRVSFSGKEQDLDIVRRIFEEFGYDKLLP